MCQCFHLIRYLSGQVFVRVPLSVITALILCRALICWGKCVWQVVVDSHVRYQNRKMSYGYVSFKNFKSFFLLVDTATNSANLVSYAHWQALRGLFLQPLHILWSVLDTFLPTDVLHAAGKSYLVTL
jgi:hypothetical protein